MIVTWVKDHAKNFDVVRGRTTREGKNGNDGADKLPVADLRVISALICFTRCGALNRHRRCCVDKKKGLGRLQDFGVSAET